MTTAAGFPAFIQMYVCIITVNIPYAACGVQFICKSLVAILMIAEKEIFSRRRDDPTVESTTIFLLASQATCNTCAVGTFRSVAVYPYRPRNFLPTQVRNSRPRGGAHAHSCHHFSSWLRRTARRQGIRMVSGGWFSRNARGERVRWMNGVRYVKYVCRIFRRVAAS